MTISKSKTLYLHPEDASTVFLKELYTGVPNATVLTKGYTKKEVFKQIEKHDRIVFAGHGTPSGLLNVNGHFKEAPGYIIDNEAVDLLKQKDNTIFIWCYASNYQKIHQLEGFSTWMFVSELSELWVAELSEKEEQFIDDSNYGFVKLVKEGISLNLSNQDLYEFVKEGYDKIALNNPVAKYNNERLYCYTKPKSK
jgi:hypothetical protein